LISLSSELATANLSFPAGFPTAHKKQAADNEVDGQQDRSDCPAGGCAVMVQRMSSKETHCVESNGGARYASLTGC